MRALLEQLHLGGVPVSPQALAVGLLLGRLRPLQRYRGEPVVHQFHLVARSVFSIRIRRRVTSAGSAGSSVASTAASG